MPLLLWDSEWSDYCQDDFRPLDDPASWDPKHAAVDRVLSRLRPSTVLDIGCNRGWHSQLAALKGANVVAFDTDEPSVTQLFLDSRERDLSIVPLIMSLTNPSPGYGVSNEWMAPATERLRGELVLALALVHHLVFKAHLDFAQVVKGLTAFAEKALVVEFVPREDVYVNEWWTESYSWYTLDDFRAELSKQWQTVEVVPSHPEPRVVLVCER